MAYSYNINCCNINYSYFILFLKYTHLAGGGAIKAPSHFRARGAATRPPWRFDQCDGGGSKGNTSQMHSWCQMHFLGDTPYMSPNFPPEIMGHLLGQSYMGTN